MTHTATPAHTADTSFKVHPLGFSAFEKSTIETFFRLAARRAPFWSVTPRIDEATVLLLNAATRQEYEAHAGRMSRTHRAVIVGSADFGTGWPVIPRPLKLTVLLTSLNIFVRDDGTLAAPAAGVASTQPPVPAPAQRLQPTYSSNFMPLHAPETAGAPLSSLGSVNGPVGPVRVEAAPVRLPVLARAALTAAVARPAPQPAQPAQAAQAAQAAPRGVELSSSTFGSLATQRSSAVSAVIAARNVLIVDDSDVALKFMQSRLRHFGYESQLARSGDEALVMTAKQDFQFVFLDVMMAGLDGYQTCRAIKQNKGKRATIPIVVMLTSRGGTIDKIRGSMSGCDAYLTKPLNEQQLGMVLAQHAATSVKKATPLNAAAGQTSAAPLVSYVAAAPSRVSVGVRSP